MSQTERTLRCGTDGVNVRIRPSLPSHMKHEIDDGAGAALLGNRFAQIVEQNLEDEHAMLNGSVRARKR